MIDSVGTPPLSRIGECVVMEIMHFHTAHNRFILSTISFRMYRVPMKKLSTMKYCPGAHARLN